MTSVLMTTRPKVTRWEKMTEADWDAHVLRSFEAKHDKNGPVPTFRPDLGPCWIWTAAVDGGRYGHFSVRGRVVRAHRWAYTTFVGPIGDGLVLDHLCRVRHCVNPAHLEPVTDYENMLRGFSLQAENARKTHCVNGHEFSPENTVTRSDGGRRCRECKRAQGRAAMRVKRSEERAA